MFYWTFMVITLGAPFEDYVSTLPYKTVAECNDAMSVVPATMGLDVAMVQCWETDVPSGSIRPKKRPVDWE